MRKIGSFPKHQRGVIELSGWALFVIILLAIGLDTLFGAWIASATAPKLIVTGAWQSVPNVSSDFIGSTGRQFSVQISGDFDGIGVNLSNVNVKLTSDNAAVSVPPAAVATNGAGIASANATAIGNTTAKVKIKASWTIQGKSDSIESEGYEVDDSFP